MRYAERERGCITGNASKIEKTLVFAFREVLWSDPEGRQVSESEGSRLCCELSAGGRKWRSPSTKTSRFSREATHTFRLSTAKFLELHVTVLQVYPNHPKKRDKVLGYCEVPLDSLTIGEHEEEYVPTYTRSRVL